MSDVDQLQAWLAIEHQAVWTYGVIGGRHEDLSDAARVAWNRHRDVRDQLTSWLTAAGQAPQGPQLGYPMHDGDSDDAARRAAQAIEAAVAVAAAAALGPDHQAAIVAAWRAAARAGTEWGGVAEAFPGLD